MGNNGGKSSQMAGTTSLNKAKHLSKPTLQPAACCMQHLPRCKLLSSFSHIVLVPLRRRRRHSLLLERGQRIRGALNTIVGQFMNFNYVGKSNVVMRWVEARSLLGGGRNNIEYCTISYVLCSSSLLLLLSIISSHVDSHALNTRIRSQ